MHILEDFCSYFRRLKVATNDSNEQNKYLINNTHKYKF